MMKYDEENKVHVDGSSKGGLTARRRRNANRRMTSFKSVMIGSIVASFIYLLVCNVVVLSHHEAMNADWFLLKAYDLFVDGMGDMDGVQKNMNHQLHGDRYLIDLVKSSKSGPGVGVGVGGQEVQTLGAQMTETDLDGLTEKLPKWEEVVNSYGDKPKIIGLDTCSTFQQNIPAHEAYIGATGMWNSGTNYFSMLMLEYCALPEAKAGTEKVKVRPDDKNKAGILYQVPWGKHNPPTWRFNHVTKTTGPKSNFVPNDGGEGVIQENVLPIVIIKDPYHWMGSMCRHSYGLTWAKSHRHCPNLIPNEIDAWYGREGWKMDRKKRMNRLSDEARRKRRKESQKKYRRKLQEEGRRIGKEPRDNVPVRVSARYQEFKGRPKSVRYDSLVDLWNQWYTNYLNITSDFPRLMIRYEDILLYPTEVITAACQCGGGTVINTNDADNRISHFEQSAKPFHFKNGTGLVKAMARYLKEDNRTDTMTEDDLNYAKEAFSSELMDLFHYKHPISSSSTTTSD